MYQLLATDMDATLLVDNEIPQASKDVIEALYRHGVTTALVTGRMVKSPRHYARQFSFGMPIIACNGGVVYTVEGELLSHYPLPMTLIEDLIAFCNLEQAFFQCYNLDALYMSGYAQRSLRRYSLDGMDYGKMQAPIIIDDNPVERIRNAGDLPVKFVIMDEDEARLDALRKEVETRPGIAVSKSHYNNLEITREEATKGQALTRLAHWMGIPMDKVVAIGDHENDVSMFRVSGLSIGVEGNSEIAVQAATVSTPAPEQGGWAQGVTRHVLDRAR